MARAEDDDDRDCVVCSTCQRASVHYKCVVAWFIILIVIIRYMSVERDGHKLLLVIFICKGTNAVKCVSLTLGFSLMRIFFHRVDRRRKIHTRNIYLFYIN